VPALVCTTLQRQKHKQSKYWRLTRAARFLHIHARSKFFFVTRSRAYASMVLRKHECAAAESVVTILQSSAKDSHQPTEADLCSQCRRMPHRDECSACRGGVRSKGRKLLNRWSCTLRIKWSVVRALMCVRMAGNAKVLLGSWPFSSAPRLQPYVDRQSWRGPRIVLFA